MFDLLNSRMLKSLFKRYGIVISLGYFASFAVLILISRRGIIEDGLTGDIIIRSQEEIVTYLPFTSSAILAVAALLFLRLLLSIRK